MVLRQRAELVLFLRAERKQERRGQETVHGAVQRLGCGDEQQLHDGVRHRFVLFVRRTVRAGQRGDRAGFKGIHDQSRFVEQYGAELRLDCAYRRKTDDHGQFDERRRRIDECRQTHQRLEQLQQYDLRRRDFGNERRRTDGTRRKNLQQPRLLRRGFGLRKRKVESWRQRSNIQQLYDFRNYAEYLFA